MINPNAEYLRHGILVETHKRLGFREFIVDVDGHLVKTLGFVNNESVKVGDHVTCWVGFSICSDSYGIRTIRRTRKDKRVDK